MTLRRNDADDRTNRLARARGLIGLGLAFTRTGRGERRLRFPDLGLTRAELSALLNEAHGVPVRGIHVDPQGRALLVLGPQH